MSERVKCLTTRVSFTSNRIWASVFEIGYLYVLTSLTIILATYLLVCFYRWNHQNNTSFVKCSALWWNDTRQHHTGEFCCEGEWKKTPIPWLCITLWELARWTLAFLLSLGWRWWWWWQQRQRQQQRRSQASKADKAMFINATAIMCILLSALICISVHRNLKDYYKTV